jgi:Predicted membrane protein
MDFKQAVTTCLKKYVEFNGRAGRPEFWWFALFCVVVSFLVEAVLGSWVGWLVNLALLLPSLAVGARRLHDMGKSGWFQLIWLIPLVGWAIMIYWLVQPSAAANQYGEGPAGPEMAALPPGAV